MRKTYLRGITLILFFGLSLSCAYAKKRNSEEAWAIAAEKMSEVGIVAEMPQLVIRKTAAVKATGETYNPYYVFIGDCNDGFIIVSGDDHLPDILGYSTGGTFDEDDLPEGLASLLEACASFVEDVETGDESALTRAAQLKAIRQTSDDNEGTVVEPLLGDIIWGQGTPYNNQCPIIDGNVTKAGCASIAMAQIMKYYNYPQYLVVDIPGYTYEYTYNDQTYSRTIDDIEAGTWYDWDNMLSSYTGTFTDEQAEAVSTLVYHCGVAAKTEYNTGTSHTNSSLSMWYEYFGFDPDLVQNLYAERFHLNDWIDIIENELINSRPIFMRGARQNSSHAFVCDGMDGTGLFHINWGWGGNYNGYFDITMLDPYSDNDGYCRSSKMYVGLTPDNGIEEGHLYGKDLTVLYTDSLSLATMDRSSMTEAFSGSVFYRWGNLTNDDFSGLVALGILDEDGMIMIIGNPIDFSVSAMNSDGSYYTKSKTLTFSYAFPIGVYCIVPVYSTDNGTSWNTCDGSDYYGFVLEATETSLTIVDKTVTASITAEDELLTGFENFLCLEVCDSLNIDYYDYLYFYGDTTNTQPSSCTEELYIRVPANGSKSYDIGIEVGNAEAYYVWVEDANGNLLINGQKFDVAYNPDPVLTITGVTTNASTTDYETENAYLYDDKVKVPIIYDDKFILTSTIENTGGLYRGNFYVKKRTLNSSGTYTRTTIRTTYRTIPANSTVTFCDTVYSYEFDDQLANVDIMKVSDGVELNEISKALQIYKVDTSGYYNLDSNRAIGYFYETSGINSVEADTFSISVIGCNIILTSDRRQTIRIYSISGQLMKVVDLGADETMNISLYPGIYVVNGIKILLQ